jgi:hypothetical protein
MGRLEQSFSRSPDSSHRVPGLGEKELSELLQNALALHEEILLSGRELIDSDSLGFVYGKDAGEAKLKEIIAGTPIEAELSVQLAYLARAITCAQVFNEGNKRFASVFMNFWLRPMGLRIQATGQEMETFMVSVLEGCPSIPLATERLHDRDAVYQYALEWLRNRIVRII